MLRKPIVAPTTEQEEREYWARFDADIAALRTDPIAWAEEMQERALWNATLLDGLDDCPYEDHRLAGIGRLS